MTNTRRRVPWAGWHQQAPTTKERKSMMKRCGKKCFLGSNQTFPICVKNSCRVSRRGAFAAYIRAKEYKTRTGKHKYSAVARKAKGIIQRGPH